MQAPLLSISTSFSSREKWPRSGLQDFPHSAYASIFVTALSNACLLSCHLIYCWLSVLGFALQQLRQPEPCSYLYCSH